MLKTLVRTSIDSRMAVKNRTMIIPFSELKDQGLHLAQVVIYNNLYNDDNQPLDDKDTTLEIKIDTTKYNLRAKAYTSLKDSAKNVITRLYLAQWSITEIKNGCADLPPTPATPFFMAIATAAHTYESHKLSQKSTSLWGAPQEDSRGLEQVKKLLIACQTKDIAGIRRELKHFFHDKREDGSHPRAHANSFVSFLLDELVKLANLEVLLDTFKLNPAKSDSYRADNGTNLKTRNAFIKTLLIEPVLTLSHDATVVVRGSMSTLGSFDSLISTSNRTSLDASNLQAQLASRTSFSEFK